LTESGVRVVILVSHPSNGKENEMDALTALTTRVSPARLAEPAPEGTALESILNAGLRAADHGKLRPWKFLLIRGEARSRLGEVMAEALRKRDPATEERFLKAEKEKPLRAPLMIVVAAAVQDNPKIPQIEQIVSAGAAAQNMLVAAHALGFGGFWRTGGPAYDEHVKHALGLKPDDTVVGFLYLGKVATAGPPKAPDPTGVVAEWTGPAA
jgi:nitroreductase